MEDKKRAFGGAVQRTFCRFDLFTFAAAGVAPAALYFVRRTQWEGDVRVPWIAAAVVCLAAVRHRIALEAMANRLPGVLRLMVCIHLLLDSLSIVGGWW